MLCLSTVIILYDRHYNRTLYEHLNNYASGKVC